MSYTFLKKEAAEFAERIKALGFTVFLAQDATYGFITDDSKSRVLTFGFGDGGTLGGNYWPPSRDSGTGWRLDTSPYALQTADDVRSALYAHPPQWCGKGWKTFTTVEQHLGMYGRSSKYAEV